MEKLAVFRAPELCMYPLIISPGGLRVRQQFSHRQHVYEKDFLCHAPVMQCDLDVPRSEAPRSV